MEAELAMLGCGRGGLEELRATMTDTEVQWAMCRVQVDVGAHRWARLAFVHLSGARCPAVVRGLAGARTAEARDILSGSSEHIHATLEVATPAGVSLAAIHERVHSGCAMEGGLQNFPIQVVLKEYDRLPALHTPRPVKPAFRTGADALRAVAEPRSQWKWVLVGPHPELLPLVACGSGSVDEMRECLAARPDQAVYGLLRLNLGSGESLRTKHVFIHAIGDKVGPVARGRSGAVRARMIEAIAQFAPSMLTLEVTGSRELTVDVVAERVYRAIVNDPSMNARLYSVEALRRALEQHASAESAPAAPGGRLTMEEAARQVRCADGPLDWVLVGLRPKGWGKVQPKDAGQAGRVDARLLAGVARPMAVRRLASSPAGLGDGRWR